VYLVLEVAYYTWELVRVVFWFMNYHSSKLVLLTVCYFALTDVSSLYGVGADGGYGNLF
jgi:hypothetical protein